MTSGKLTTYSQEFKEEAVRLYIEGEGGYKKIAAQLGLKDTKTLRNWVKKVQQGESLEDMRGKTIGCRAGKPRTKFASFEDELAYYKAESAYLKKLYRSRFGHEWGADMRTISSKS